MNERFTRATAVARIELAHEPDFTLGLLQVRPSLREIVCDGRGEIIDPRVMQVLVALARVGGGVVSRDDLIESCWDGVVVGEDALTNCVARLRKAAEAAGNAFTIETVPRVGYRLKLVQPASRDGQKPAAPKPASMGPPLAPVPMDQARRTKWFAALSSLLLLVFLAAGFQVWRFWPARPVPVSKVPAGASVAVLPFVNMSGDPKNDYFGDGFSEELVNDLSNVPHLYVASRTSSFAFKGRDENIAKIARALNVHAIVEGSVREFGDRVRITTQLIDGNDGYHLWSGAYDRKVTDILSLQGELARAIAAALTHELIPAPATPRPKIDPAVYRLFLEGIHQFDLGPQGWRKALAIFHQVTVRAPDFADGFAWLSRATFDMATNYDVVPASGLALASDAAQRALSLDPHNIMAQSFHALVELQTWNWRAAASDFRKLRNHNPDNYFTIMGIRNYYMDLGFPDQAFAEWQHLYATDPQTYRTSWVTNTVFRESGRFQEEIRVLQTQLVHGSSDAPRQADLCLAYAATGKIAEAQAVKGRLRSLQTDLVSQINFQGCEWSIDLATGDRTHALTILRVWVSEFPDRLAGASGLGSDYILLGDFDKASDWFERGYESREPGYFRSFTLRGLGAEKAFERYRRTPGYKALALKPLFREWQAEHDRIAAALAAHRDPLN